MELKNQANSIFHEKTFSMKDSFTEKNRTKISKQLEKNLSKEYLSIRRGAGGCKLTYIEGWVVIDLANKIFGFDGWSSEIRDFTQEYISSTEAGINVGFSCCCRVTLKNGIYREDVGFGASENMKSMLLAIEKAKKTAATDALKRALRQFGNALGNCCYDKKFLLEIEKTNQQNGNAKNSRLLKRSDFEETIDSISADINWTDSVS